MLLAEASGGKDKMPTRPSLCFLLELEGLSAALEGAGFFATAILSGGTALLALFDHLQFEATSLAHVNLADFHLVTIWHVSDSLQILDAIEPGPLAGCFASYVFA
jgi:hypothetical protein